MFQKSVLLFAMAANAMQEEEPLSATSKLESLYKSEGIKPKDMLKWDQLAFNQNKLEATIITKHMSYGNCNERSVELTQESYTYIKEHCNFYSLHITEGREYGNFICDSDLEWKKIDENELRLSKQVRFGTWMHIKTEDNDKDYFRLFVPTTTASLPVSIYDRNHKKHFFAYKVFWHQEGAFNFEVHYIRPNDVQYSLQFVEEDAKTVRRFQFNENGNYKWWKQQGMRVIGEGTNWNPVIVKSEETMSQTRLLNLKFKKEWLMGMHLHLGSGYTKRFQYKL